MQRRRLYQYPGDATVSAQRVDSPVINDCVKIETVEVKDNGEIAKQTLITETLVDAPAEVDETVETSTMEKLYKFMYQKLMLLYGVKKPIKLCRMDLKKAIAIALGVDDKNIRITSDDNVADAGCLGICTKSEKVKILVDGKDFYIAHNETTNLLRSLMIDTQECLT